MTPVEVLELCGKKRAWQQSWAAANPADASRQRRRAAQQGWVAPCDDPLVELRASVLERLASVALAAAEAIDALESVEDLAPDEAAALDLLRGGA